MSYTSTRDLDCQLTSCISLLRGLIFGHQKLLTRWVHSGWGVFLTILKLCIRSRLITAIHLALQGHMNAVWRSQRHAMLLLTGKTLKPHDLCRTVFQIVVLIFFLVLEMFINGYRVSFREGGGGHLHQIASNTRSKIKISRQHATGPPQFAAYFAHGYILALYLGCL